MVGICIKAIEIGCSMRDALLLFIAGREQIHFHDLAAEVRFVEFGIENGFIKRLQLQQGEFFWQQIKTDRLMTNLMTQELHSMIEYFRMVVNQLGLIIDAEPAGIRGAVTFDHRIVYSAHQRIIGNSDYAVIGEAINTTKCL